MTDEKKVRFDIDHAKQRLVRRPQGSVDFDERMRAFLEFFEAHPDTVDYDIINDYQDYAGALNWDEISSYSKRVAAYMTNTRAIPLGRKVRRKRVAFVWRDPMAETLVRAISALYKDMVSEFRVFANLTEAHAWLDTSPPPKDGSA